MLGRSVHALVVLTIEDDFLAGRGLVEGSEQGAEIGIEGELARIHHHTGKVTGGFQELLGVGLDVRAGLHGLVVLVIDIPGTFVQHATGSDGAHHILVDVVLAVVLTHVGNGELEVFQALVHDLGTRVTGLELGLHIVGSHFLVEVRNVAEAQNQTAVFPATEEAGHTHPVIVFLVSEVVTFLHGLQTGHEKVPFTDIGEVPGGTGTAGQPYTTVSGGLGTVPVVGRDGEQDVALHTGGGVVVAVFTCRVYTRGVYLSPVVGIAAEVVSVSAVHKQTDVLLGSPISNVIQRSQVISGEEVLATGERKSKSGSEKDIDKLFHMLMLN